MKVARLRSIGVIGGLRDLSKTFVLIVKFYAFCGRLSVLQVMFCFYSIWINYKAWLTL